MLWLSLIGVAMMTTIVSCKVESQHETQQEDKQDSLVWESTPFFPCYIITMKESRNSLGESCYWLIYNDLNAGFDNEVVSMDEETYHIIHDMWKISMRCNSHYANQYNADLLRMMEDYEPIIHNNNGTAVLLLSDED